MAYSFLDLEKEVLSKAETPLTFQQIWEQAKVSGLAAKLWTKGKTPRNTLGAQLYVEVRDNPQLIFAKVGKRPAMPVPWGRNLKPRQILSFRLVHESGAGHGPSNHITTGLNPEVLR